MIDATTHTRNYYVSMNQLLIALYRDITSFDLYFVISLMTIFEIQHSIPKSGLTIQLLLVFFIYKFMQTWRSNLGLQNEMNQLDIATLL